MKYVPIAFRLGKHYERRRFEPSRYLFTSPWWRRRRRENSFVRHDREKLMYARPRQRPRRVTLCEFSNAFRGPLVPRAVTTMGIH